MSKGEVTKAKEGGVNPINAKGTSSRGSMKSREGEIGNSTRERLSVFDKNGREVYRSDNGENDRIEVPSGLSLKDKIVTHNHPNGNSFSRGDMIEAVKNDLQEIRAVYKNTVFSLKRPSGGWNVDDEAISKAYSAAMMKIAAADSSYQSRGGAAFSRSMQTMNRRIVREVAKELGLKYTKSKVK